MELYQHQFHEEWSHLRDRHVRALVWLLTSPGLLDQHAAVWGGKIMCLSLPPAHELQVWFAHIDQHPTELHEFLGIHDYLRLGHYAENLLAFYFKHQGMLYGHGIQVHNARMTTIGEFDFLLFEPGGLLHLEIATKFYLMRDQVENNKANSDALRLDAYVGPNLNDNFAAKMHKIIHQQLVLSHRHEVPPMLPQPIVAARALIKGWLFYRMATRDQHFPSGIARDHCRGYWWTLEEFRHLAITSALILERLQWLAPAQVEVDDVTSKEVTVETIRQHFQGDASPVLVAIMKRQGDTMQEFCRGMVVPHDWQLRANQYQA